MEPAEDWIGWCAAENGDDRIVREKASTQKVSWSTSSPRFSCLPELIYASMASFSLPRILLLSSATKILH